PPPSTRFPYPTLFRSRYLAVGVTSASPTGATSQAFLEWLSLQDAGVLEQHIGCVLRHILHRSGPENWAGVFTEVPFIPARDGSGDRKSTRLNSSHVAS